MLKLWDDYRTAHEELTQSKLRDWCEKRFLGFLRMREWRELHRQLLLSCEELGWVINDQVAEYAPLHRALIAGLPTQIGHRVEKGLYEAPRQRKFALFPGSTLVKQPPAWLLVATMLDTQKIWGLMGARIEPDWVIAELVASALASPFRSALVARAGPGDRLRADQPVRPGAGAEEAGALRRPVSGRVARYLRAPGAA